MTRNYHTSTEYICDRCGTSTCKNKKGWGQIEADVPDLKIGGGFDDYEPSPADLCPDCTRSFIEWWNAGREPKP